MKFKILKGTLLFKKFVDLQKEMARVEKLSFALMKEVDSIGIRGGDFTVCGGISSFIFKKGVKKPDGWKNSFKNEPWEYMPAKNRAVSKKILAKVEALPSVPYSVFKDIICYDFRDHVGNRISFMPGVDWFDEYVLISIGEQYPRYKPVSGMIEITTSEYNRLAERVKPKKNKLSK